MMMIVVYVHDFILLNNNANLLESIKKFLSKKFEMIDLRSHHFCLGMEILYDKERGIISTQSTKIHSKANIIKI
jgi:hypothetical protein